MSYKALFLTISATALMSAGAFAAGPPAGVTMGPPAFVTMGPPASVTMGPPASVTMGPPASVTMGPPPGVTMGPPAAALAHIPAGVPLGKPANLPVGGNSIGTTVSGSARAQAAANGGASTNVSVDAPDTTETNTDTNTSIMEANAASELGKLNAAHASPIALQHANANSAVGAIASYDSQMNAALALTDPTARDAAVTAARQQLALVSNKQLTASAVTKLDSMLGIAGADPTLGTSP